MNKVPFVIMSAIDMPTKKRRVKIHWPSFLFGILTGIGIATGALLAAGAIQ